MGVGVKEQGVRVADRAIFGSVMCDTVNLLRKH